MLPTFLPLALVLMLVSATSAAAQAAAPQDTARLQALLDRGVDEFERGRIAESAAAFDELAKAAPRIMPELWQRGIVLYYAGRYTDCRQQFEAHRKVNPNDVENAVWHFLCVARQESAARARTALLPVGPDRRAPMGEVYELFRGELAVEDVIVAAGTSPSALFFAYLYTGLYFEATGDARRARAALTNAAADRYRDVGGYMHMVAKVHVALLDRR
jgi:lipoprotein NlpI